MQNATITYIGTVAAKIIANEGYTLVNTVNYTYGKTIICPIAQVSLWICITDEEALLFIQNANNN